jgi:hypothetical protein
MIDASMGLPPHFFGASRSIQNRLRMLPNFFSRSASASYCRMKTPHTTQLSIPFHMLQATSAANATNESGGEAEIADGVGVRRWAATRSLRSAREAAHSVVPRKSSSEHQRSGEHPTKGRRGGMQGRCANSVTAWGC